MIMTGQDYDLVVIGSGPAGQKAAINAAKLGKHVVVIERAGMVGGVSVHTGTIPCKTVRDAVLYLTGFNERRSTGTSTVFESRSTERRSPVACGFDLNSVAIMS
jgi:NAD(P) transhydrogenase